MGFWTPGPVHHPGYYRIVAGGELLPKTFAPQLVRLIRHVCLYITKHKATLTNTLSGPELAALILVQSACDAFINEVITETP